MNKSGNDGNKSLFNIKSRKSPSPSKPKSRPQPRTDSVDYKEDLILKKVPVKDVEQEKEKIKEFHSFTIRGTGTELFIDHLEAFFAARGMGFPGASYPYSTTSLYSKNGFGYGNDTVCCDLSVWLNKSEYFSFIKFVSKFQGIVLEE